MFYLKNTSFFDKIYTLGEFMESLKKFVQEHQKEAECHRDNHSDDSIDWAYEDGHVDACGIFLRKIEDLAQIENKSLDKHVYENVKIQLDKNDITMVVEYKGVEYALGYDSEDNLDSNLSTMVSHIEESSD